MTFELPEATLRSIVTAVVAEVLDVTGAAGAKLGDERLAYSESEAASLLGVRAHVLRDARLRDEIKSTRVGGRISYERTELLAYLARQRVAI